MWALRVAVMLWQDHVRDSSISLPMEFSVQVLTSGFWPSYSPDQLTIAPYVHVPTRAYACLHVSACCVPFALTMRLCCVICTVCALRSLSPPAQSVRAVH